VEIFAAIIVPTIGLLVVIGLPWLDRSTTRSIANRKTIMGTLAIVLVAIVALSIYAQAGIQTKIAASGAPVKTQQQIFEEFDASVASAAEASAGGAGAQLAAGKSVYGNNCASCHGAAGTGTPGLAPPLAGNPFVTGDAKPVIGVLLHGLKGQQIMGQSYGAPMPAWKGTLSNKDIADVITYIRGGLGANKASAVSEADIK
jgi:mono/diheme cytochrome c family protein